MTRQIITRAKKKNAIKIFYRMMRLPKFIKIVTIKLFNKTLIAWIPSEDVPNYVWKLYAKQSKEKIFISDRMGVH